jgi:hypothetical protein
VAQEQLPSEHVPPFKQVTLSQGSGSSFLQEMNVVDMAKAKIAKRVVKEFMGSGFGLFYQISESLRESERSIRKWLGIGLSAMQAIGPCSGPRQCDWYPSAKFLPRIGP